MIGVPAQKGLPKDKAALLRLGVDLDPVALGLIEAGNQTVRAAVGYDRGTEMTVELTAPASVPPVKIGPGPKDLAADAELKKLAAALPARHGPDRAAEPPDRGRARRRRGRVRRGGLDRDRQALGQGGPGRVRGARREARLPSGAAVAARRPGRGALVREADEHAGPAPPRAALGADGDARGQAGLDRLRRARGRPRVRQGRGHVQRTRTTRRSTPSATRSRRTSCSRAASARAALVARKDARARSGDDGRLAAVILKYRATCSITGALCAGASERRSDRSPQYPARVRYSRGHKRAQ